VNALRRQAARQRFDEIAAMLDAGFSQAEIASRLNVNPSVISRAVKRITWARRARPVHRRLILSATDAEIDMLQPFELVTWVRMMDNKHKRKVVKCH
jgi:IS30 family transposase